MNLSVKKCNKCNNTKSIYFFHKRKSSIDGYEYCCKECKKTYDKQYKTNNADLIQEYILNNKEKISLIAEKYHAENKQKINEYHKILLLIIVFFIMFFMIFIYFLFIFSMIFFSN